MDQYLKLITEYKTQADELVDDNAIALMQKIDLMSKCLVLIGKVSSIMDGDYKRIYANRKYELALAEINAPSPKKANAEVEVHHLRMQEAEAYEQMQRWRNAFESVKEEVHALKLKMKIMFQDGSDSQS